MAPAFHVWASRNKPISASFFYGSHLEISLSWQDLGGSVGFKNRICIVLRVRSPQPLEVTMEIKVFLISLLIRYVSRGHYPLVPRNIPSGTLNSCSETCSRNYSSQAPGPWHQGNNLLCQSLLFESYWLSWVGL